MIEATLADMRKSTDFFATEEIIHILDGRKKEEIGYFVPKSLKDEFNVFIEKVEKKRKLALLKRVAEAQKKDRIGDGAVDDGL